MLGLVNRTDIRTLGRADTRLGVLANTHDFKGAVQPDNVKRESHIVHPHTPTVGWICEEEEHASLGWEPVAIHEALLSGRAALDKFCSKSFTGWCAEEQCIAVFHPTY